MPPGEARNGMPERLVGSLSDELVLRGHMDSLESVTMLVRRFAHSLNNILAVSRGNVAMLRDSMRDRESKEMIDDVMASLSEAQTLSENLVALGIHRRFKPKMTPLGDFLEDYVRRLLACRDSRWQIALDIPRQLPWVSVDPGYLEFALNALVKNACEAMDGTEVGEICIRTHVFNEAGRSGVGIMILDSAGGLRQRDRLRAFDIGTSSKGRHGHIGLGLWYARQVMRACGGDARVRSAGQEDGDFVELMLPCKDLL